VTSAEATADDRRWMALAVELSRQCPVVDRAYAVGAVLVDEAGQEITRGWSRDTDDHVHAEESALAKVPADDPRLATATLYSTLEPCSQRKSRPKTCTQLILDRPIPRIVIGWREPAHFVDDCQGYEDLVKAGRTVIEMPEFADQVKAVNAHLFGPEAK
jgi:diaminohydroxyphosphoribosylaminopyrimidine deaminase/5-amino-6-(5-phosphoribosylamino)uracil reductase